MGTRGAAGGRGRLGVVLQGTRPPRHSADTVNGRGIGTRVPATLAPRLEDTKFNPAPGMPEVHGRARDLDAFAYGGPRDVMTVDDGDGLQWVLIGMVPQRRPLLRAAYGFLTLRSGVPIGDGQLDTGSSTLTPCWAGPPRLCAAAWISSARTTWYSPPIFPMNYLGADRNGRNRRRRSLSVRTPGKCETHPSRSRRAG